MIILFLIILLLVYCFLNEYELKKYKKYTNKKIKALIKRLKMYENNQDNVFDYINDIYNELEGVDFSEKSQKSK